MIKTKIQIGIILLCLLGGAFTLAQTIGIAPINPTFSVCGDGDFTISVSNTSGNPVTNVVVTATVPADFSFREATDSRGAGFPPDATGLPDVVYQTFDLAPNDSAPGGPDEWTGTITISPDCDAPTYGARLNVVVEWDDPLNPGVRITDTINSGPITTLKPNLVIDIVPNRPQASVGDTVSWDVEAKNTGVGTMYNVEITVATPGLGLTLNVPPAMVPSDFLIGTIPSIAPGDTENLSDYNVATSTISTTVNSCANLTMSATADYGGCGTGGTDVCGSAAPVEDSVELVYRTPALDYTIAPATLAIPYCGPATVTINISNNGATAGNIRQLYMAVIFPPAVNLVTAPAPSHPYVDLPDSHDPGNTKSGFNVGDIPAGGAAALTFQIEWANTCNPADCETLVFEPYFLDDCGGLFQPPVKELPVSAPPPRPSFSVTKTMTVTSGGDSVLDEGETATFDITVTYNGYGTETARADIRDTYPAAFVINGTNPVGVTAPCVGPPVANCLSWDDQAFAPGSWTRHFYVDVTAHYAGLSCGANLTNTVQVVPTDSVCTVGATSCDPTGASYTMPLFTAAGVGADILSVAKAGPNLLYIDDPTYQRYEITVTYTGPLCGAGKVMPPVRVFDTLAGAHFYYNAGNPADPMNPSAGGVVGTGAVTWTIPAGYGGWDTTGAAPTLTLSAYLRLETAAPYNFDECNCGRMVYNSARAELWRPACVTCSATGTFGIGVACDNEDTAPFTLTKAMNNPGVTREVCDCTAGSIEYTNTISFTNLTGPVTWDQVFFTENGDYGQEFLGGGRTDGAATFSLNGGPEIPVTDFDLGSEYQLDDAFGAGGPVNGNWVTIKYTLCLHSTGTPANFIDWSDLRVVGYSAPCTGPPPDTEFHTGVWVAASYPAPTITIADFCKYEGAVCTFVINECDDATFKIDFTLTNPAYVVKAKVDLEDNYAYKAGTSTLNGVPVANPSQTLQVLTWDITNPATPGVPLAPGDYELEFNLYKDCDVGNETSSWIEYQNRCYTAMASPVRTYPYHAVATRFGRIYIKKTPEIIYTKNRTDDIIWKIYVTNSGSGVANNVNVVDTMDLGLLYNTTTPYTYTGLDPGATISLDNPDDRNLTWLISSIDPGHTVEITFRANYAPLDCDDPESCGSLTNQVFARWGCMPVSPTEPCCATWCETTAPVSSRVQELDTKVSLTQFTATRVDLCENPATVTIRFQNIGETSAYCPKVTVTLPSRSGSPALVVVPGTSELNGVPLGWEPVTPPAPASPYDRVWDLSTELASGILPGAANTLTFQVRANGCNYVNGDVLITKVGYKTPCMSVKETPTLSIPTQSTGDTTLTISKSPDPITAQPGTLVQWEIRIRNTGGYRAKNVRLWDTLLNATPSPANLTFVSIAPAATNPGPVPSGGSGSSTDPWVLGDMPTGTRWWYTISARVKDSPAGCDRPQPQYNQASVRWGCCSIEDDTNSASTAVYTTPLVSLTQGVLTSITNCGGRISVTFSNAASRTPAFDIVVTDRLPAGLIHDITGTTTVTSSTRGALPSTPVSGAGTDVITWNSATNFDTAGVGIAAGEQITIEFDVVHLTGDCDNPINGDNRIDWQYEDVCNRVYPLPVDVNNSPNNSTFNAPLPVFNITKIPVWQVIPPGGTAAWDVTITNTGGLASGTVTVRDTLGEDYDLATVTVTGDLSIPGPPATRVIEWTGLTLNPGGTPGDTITYHIEAAPLAGSREARLNNTVDVYGTCGTGCQYAHAGPVVAYVGYTDIAKDLPPTATINERVPVTIYADYYGNNTRYDNVSVEDTLPVGMGYVGNARVNGRRVTPGVVGSVVTFSLGSFTVTPVPFPPVRRFTITFDAVIENVPTNFDGAILTNNVRTIYWVTGTRFEDSARDDIEVVYKPLLVTDKEVTAIDGNATNTETVTIGDIVDYSYTITNVGIGAAYSLDVTDILPTGFEYVVGSASIPPSSVVNDREIYWMGLYAPPNPPLAAGASFTITFQAEVTPTTPTGELINRASVVGEDRRGGAIIKNGSEITPLDTDRDDSDTASVFIPTQPVYLTKNVDLRGVHPGGLLHYTLTFTNNQKIRYLNVTVTDTLPSGFRYEPGTTLINGAPSDDPTGDNPYTWTLGTILGETTTTVEYNVLVTLAAKTGANTNTAVLSARDAGGNVLSLSAQATVSVLGTGFPMFDRFPFLARWFGPAPTPEEKPERPVEEKERPRPECCLHVAAIPVRSQEFGDTLPGYPEIYYQTDIAMYGATELLLTKKRLIPWLEVQGIDPEPKHLMTGLYNRMVEKLGEYAEFNLGNVVMESTLGIPLAYAPGLLEAARGKGATPERLQGELLKNLAERAGLSDVPNIQPIFLEYFGSYPYLHERIAEDKLAWEERLMDKNVMPAALGFTMLREASQIETFLVSADPTERFFGRLLLVQSVEKTKSISADLAKSAEFSPPVKYLPHFSRIEVDKNKPGLVWRTTDETSTLYDHVSVLWGLSKLRSVVAHSADPEVRGYVGEITGRMDEVYRAIEAIHHDKGNKTFVSIHRPGGAESERTIAAKDLGFTILALRSVYFENRDLSIITIDPKRKVAEIADFMIEKLMADDGGIYTAYDYTDGSPVVGTKRTLVDNALAVRALLSAYTITEDRKYRKAALEVYDFMVKELWREDLLIFVDEEDPDYEVVLTPQSIGALIGALRELVLSGDPEMRYDYLDRMSYTTDRILDQSQLQLYENRFFPWYAPITIVPDDPNGRSYVKPIITTIRDKGITYDLAPILVRKMVLNITPAGAVASGNEAAVSDFSKWKANLHYEVPDIIASAVIDDTFVSDEGMYFTSLMHDYRRNLSKNLPSFNPYDTDPGIPFYAAYVSDEVSRFNVKNLTLNSGMGIKVSESELVRRLAKDNGTTPERFMEDFIERRAPQRGGEGDRFIGRIVDKVKDISGIGTGGRFANIIYLEYASGKPFYTGDIGDGWDETTFDRALATSSTGSTMARQILLLMEYDARTDLSNEDRFVRDTVLLCVAAKRVALDEIIGEANKGGAPALPHGFEMTWDDKEERYVPRITNKSATLFDEVFLIWATALFIDARDRGLMDEYRSYLGDAEDDGRLLETLIDSLMKDHYGAAYGTLVTGSVNTVEVSKALDILTRAAELMPEGAARDKLMKLIHAQADFIINRLISETGIRPMVGLGDEQIPADLCEHESLGTNVFPILALYRTWEVTGDEKYLKTALSAFKQFDKTKWDQQLGLYLSNGTIYTAPDRTKLELEYTNQELIAAILLVSELQPKLAGEEKIVSAYHMTTFMNRIMEIASVERYPENEESPKTIFSPEIIRSVKIILSDSKGTGRPGDVFTYRIVVDNDCADEIDRTLSRVRVELTLPDGIYHVPGSTRINGTPGPDPIGTRTLSWYLPLLRNGGRTVIDYQVVADKGLAAGTYPMNLSVRGFWGWGGGLWECSDLDTGVSTVIVKDLWPQDTKKECVPCDVGPRALYR